MKLRVDVFSLLALFLVILIMLSSVYVFASDDDYEEYAGGGVRYDSSDPYNKNFWENPHQSDFNKIPRHVWKQMPDDVINRVPRDGRFEKALKSKFKGFKGKLRELLRKKGQRARLEDGKLVVYEDDADITNLDLDEENIVSEINMESEGAPEQTTTGEEEPEIEIVEDAVIVDETRLEDARNIRYEDEVLKADAPEDQEITEVVIHEETEVDYEFTGEVEHLQDGETILSDVENPKSVDDEITFDYAEKVETLGYKDLVYYVFSSIKNSKLVVDSVGRLMSAVVVSNKDNNELEIGKQEIDVTLDKDGKLSFDDATYTIEKGEISYTGEEVIETVKSEKPAQVNLDFSPLNGFYSLKLSKDSKYELEFKDDFHKDFMIVPKVNDYVIFIRKIGEQSIDTSSMTTNDWALVDLVENKILINGLADFYKKGDADFVKIIETTDPRNNYYLQFGEDFIYFDMKLSNNNVFYKTIAKVFFGDYVIKEELIGNSVHTIAEFVHENIPSYVKSYEHEFNLDYVGSVIIFQSGKLMQLTSTNMITLFSSEIADSNYVNEVGEYKPTWCDEFNDYYYSNLGLTHYFDSFMSLGIVTGGVVKDLNSDVSSYFAIFIVLFAILFALFVFKRFNKKSQISWIIAVGIVLVIVFTLLFELAGYSLLYEDASAMSVKEYTTSCVSKVVHCSLMNQGFNYRYLKKNFYSVDNNLFQVTTKDYLDKVLMKCYDDMPPEHKDYVTVNKFDSNVRFSNRVLIEINTDISYEDDQYREKFNVFKLSVPIKMNDLVRFAETIDKIDLSYLGESGYNIRVYEMENEPLYVITDPGSKLFDKEFKLLVQ